MKNKYRRVLIFKGPNPDIINSNVNYSFSIKHDVQDKIYSGTIRNIVFNIKHPIINQIKEDLKCK